MSLRDMSFCFERSFFKSVYQLQNDHLIEFERLIKSRISSLLYKNKGTTLHGFAHLPQTGERPL